MSAHLPTAAENPAGLHLKYHITKADGSPVDQGAEYFCLRVDPAAEMRGRNASLAALAAYADAIEIHIPKLAADLREKYGLKPGVGIASGYGDVSEIVPALRDSANAIEAHAPRRARFMFWIRKS